MNQCQTDTTPVARKDHVCQECGCVIPKGTTHHLQKGVLDGSWYSWRVHSDCAELYWKANRDAGNGWYDDWYPLSEWCVSELEYLRGHFPHAICRLELRREIQEINWQKRQAATAA